MQHVKSEGLLGGELAMWTDSYRKAYNCEKLDPEDKKHPIPIAHWMFEAEYDKEFSTSMLGMVIVMLNNNSLSVWCSSVNGHM